MVDQVGRSITLQQVANLAAVSIATASRALNGGTRNVREDLRERVLEAAQILGYSANAQAQAMARGRSNIVGLLVQDITDPYFSSIASGVMNAAEEHGLLVTLGSTLRRPEREIEYIRALRGQRARAAILAGSRINDRATMASLKREIAAFVASGGRFVAISQHLIGVDSVVVENRLGARDLACELVALGYRKPAVLAGPEELITARDRLRGYREGFALSGIDLPDALVMHGPFTRAGGYEAMSAILDRGLEVDCIFAVNDVMAVGAMAACQDRGLSLPEDMALAGFDDIETLRDVSPSLTTVRLPLEAIGEAALDLVLTGTDGAKPRVQRVKGQVVIRESTPKIADISNPVFSA